MIVGVFNCSHGIIYEAKIRRSRIRFHMSLYIPALSPLCCHLILTFRSYVYTLASLL
jgi:hypothetical protein